jgi:hypothetical protein
MTSSPRRSLFVTLSSGRSVPAQTPSVEADQGERRMLLPSALVQLARAVTILSSQSLGRWRHHDEAGLEVSICRKSLNFRSHVRETDMTSPHGVLPNQNARIHHVRVVTPPRNRTNRGPAARSIPSSYRSTGSVETMPFEDEWVSEI